MRVDIMGYDATPVFKIGELDAGQQSIAENPFRARLLISVEVSSISNTASDPELFGYGVGCVNFQVGFLLLIQRNPVDLLISALPRACRVARLGVACDQINDTGH